MTAEFLAFSQAAGNDLSTPRPECGFPGLKPGDRWCLCAPRWAEALAAGCAPQVVLRATRRRAGVVQPGRLAARRATAAPAMEWRRYSAAISRLAATARIQTACRGTRRRHSGAPGASLVRALMPIAAFEIAHSARRSPRPRCRAAGRRRCAACSTTSPCALPSRSRPPSHDPEPGGIVRVQHGRRPAFALAGDVGVSVKLVFRNLRAGAVTRRKGCSAVAASWRPSGRAARGMPAWRRPDGGPVRARSGTGRRASRSRRGNGCARSCRLAIHPPPRRSGLRGARPAGGPQRRVRQLHRGHVEARVLGAQPRGQALQITSWLGRHSPGGSISLRAELDMAVAARAYRCRRARGTSSRAARCRPGRPSRS